MGNREDSGPQLRGNNCFSGGSADVIVVGVLWFCSLASNPGSARYELGDRRSQGACRPQAVRKRGKMPHKVKRMRAEHSKQPTHTDLIILFLYSLCPPYSPGPISNFMLFLTLTYPHLYLCYNQRVPKQTSKQKTQRKTQSISWLNSMTLQLYRVTCWAESSGQFMGSANDLL